MNIDEMQAGPDTDRLVAEGVMEWEQINAWWQPKDNSRAEWPVNLWHPSTDIVTAWVVFERINKLGFHLSLFNRVVNKAFGLEKFDIGMWRNGHAGVGASAPTAPLAICRAALKAVLGIDKV